MLVLCGVLADCSNFSEIHDYGVDKEVFLLTELGLELAIGLPSEDTLWRVLRRQRPKELDVTLGRTRA